MHNSLTRRICVEAVENTPGHKLADAPTHNNPSLQVSSKHHWSNFGRVGRRNCSKDSPWKPTQQFTNEKHLDILREEQEKDHAGEENQPAENGLSVSDALAEETLKELEKSQSGLTRKVS